MTTPRFMLALELKLPPGVVALLCGGVMWLAARADPWVEFELGGRWIGALAAFGAGVAVAAAGVISFQRAKTTFNPMRPGSASTLVTSGIYRWTRNPMYLGVLLMLAGWAVFLAKVLPLLVLPGFVAYLHWFQIVPEERALVARFGRDFLAYQAKVRRWL